MPLFCFFAVRLKGEMVSSCRLNLSPAASGNSRCTCPKSSRGRLKAGEFLACICAYTGTRRFSFAIPISCIPLFYFPEPEQHFRTNGNACRGKVGIQDRQPEEREILFLQGRNQILHRSDILLQTILFHWRKNLLCEQISGIPRRVSKRTLGLIHFLDGFRFISHF